MLQQKLTVRELLLASCATWQTDRSPHHPQAARPPACRLFSYRRLWYLACASPIWPDAKTCECVTSCMKMLDYVATYILSLKVESSLEFGCLHVALLAYVILIEDVHCQLLTKFTILVEAN